MIFLGKFSWELLGTPASVAMEREGSSVCVEGLHSCQPSHSVFSELFTGANSNAVVLSPVPLVTVVVPAPFLLLTQLLAFLLIQNLAFKLRVSFLFPPLCSPRPVTFMSSTPFSLFLHTSPLNSAFLARYRLLCALSIFT